jgi:hypothetical protein
MEWCKARARMLRWKEEAMLLHKEMRRAMISLNIQARQWQDRAVVHANSPALDEGRNAYAFRQASIRWRTMASFNTRWSKCHRVDLPLGDDPDAIIKILAESPSDALVSLSRHADGALETFAEMVQEAMDGYEEDDLFIERDTT